MQARYVRGSATFSIGHKQYCRSVPAIVTDAKKNYLFPSFEAPARINGFEADGAGQIAVAFGMVNAERAALTKPCSEINPGEDGESR